MEAGKSYLYDASEEINIYGDISEFDLGIEIEKLRAENKRLEEQIETLQNYIEQLNGTIMDLKETQNNLSNNISSLFKTAKAEIERKDRMIENLRTQLEDRQLSRYNTNTEHGKRKHREGSPPSVTNNADYKFKKFKTGDITTRHMLDHDSEHLYTDRHHSGTSYSNDRHNYPDDKYRDFPKPSFSKEAHFDQYHNDGRYESISRHSHDPFSDYETFDSKIERTGRHGSYEKEIYPGEPIDLDYNFGDRNDSERQHRSDRNTNKLGRPDAERGDRFAERRGINYSRNSRNSHSKDRGFKEKKEFKEDTRGYRHKDKKSSDRSDCRQIIEQRRQIHRTVRSRSNTPPLPDVREDNSCKAEQDEQQVNHDLQKSDQGPNSTSLSDITEKPSPKPPKKRLKMLDEMEKKLKQNRLSQSNSTSPTKTALANDNTKSKYRDSLKAKLVVSDSEFKCVPTKQSKTANEEKRGTKAKKHAEGKPCQPIVQNHVNGLTNPTAENARTGNLQSPKKNKRRTTLTKKNANSEYVDVSKSVESVTLESGAGASPKLLQAGGIEGRLNFDTPSLNLGESIDDSHETMKSRKNFGKENNKGQTKDEKVPKLNKDLFVSTEKVKEGGNEFANKNDKPEFPDGIDYTRTGERKGIYYERTDQKSKDTGKNDKRVKDEKEHQFINVDNKIEINENDVNKNEMDITCIKDNQENTETNAVLKEYEVEEKDFTSNSLTSVENAYNEVSGGYLTLYSRRQAQRNQANKILKRNMISEKERFFTSTPERNKKLETKPVLDMEQKQETQRISKMFEVKPNGNDSRTDDKITKDSSTLEPPQNKTANIHLNSNITKVNDSSKSATKGPDEDKGNDTSIKYENPTCMKSKESTIPSSIKRQFYTDSGDSKLQKVCAKTKEVPSGSSDSSQSDNDSSNYSWNEALTTPLLEINSVKQASNKAISSSSDSATSDDTFVPSKPQNNSAADKKLNSLIDHYLETLVLSNKNVDSAQATTVHSKISNSNEDKCKAEQSKVINKEESTKNNEDNSTVALRDESENREVESCPKKYNHQEMKNSNIKIIDCVTLPKMEYNKEIPVNCLPKGSSGNIDNSLNVSTVEQNDSKKELLSKSGPTESIIEGIQNEISHSDADIIENSITEKTESASKQKISAAKKLENVIESLRQNKSKKSLSSEQESDSKNCAKPENTDSLYQNKTYDSTINIEVSKSDNINNRLISNTSKVRDSASDIKANSEKQKSGDRGEIQDISSDSEKKQSNREKTEESNIKTKTDTTKKDSCRNSKRKSSCSKDASSNKNQEKGVTGIQKGKNKSRSSKEQIIDTKVAKISSKHEKQKDVERTENINTNISKKTSDSKSLKSELMCRNKDVTDNEREKKINANINKKNEKERPKNSKPDIKKFRELFGSDSDIDTQDTPNLTTGEQINNLVKSLTQGDNECEKQKYEHLENVMTEIHKESSENEPLEREQKSSERNDNEILINRDRCNVISNAYVEMNKEIADQVVETTSKLAEKSSGKRTRRKSYIVLHEDTVNKKNPNLDNKIEVAKKKIDESSSTSVMAVQCKSKEESTSNPTKNIPRKDPRYRINEVKRRISFCSNNEICDTSKGNQSNKIFEEFEREVKNENTVIKNDAQGYLFGHSDVICSNEKSSDVTSDIVKIFQSEPAENSSVICLDSSSADTVIICTPDLPIVSKESHNTDSDSQNAITNDKSDINKGNVNSEPKAGNATITTSKAKVQILNITSIVHPMEENVIKTFAKDTLLAEQNVDGNITNPVNKEKTSTDSSGYESPVTQSCSSNKEKLKAKKRITPTPVRDSKPLSSFENILIKTSQSSTFTSKEMTSPLHLTHEGEIPILHIEESQINNLPTEITINDRNILSLLDAMNISNIDSDISKFKNVAGEPVQISEDNSAENANNTFTFENIMEKVASSPIISSPKRNCVIGNSDVSKPAKITSNCTPNSATMSISSNKTVNSNSQSNLTSSIQRRRRRCRLVIRD